MYSQMVRCLLGWRTRALREEESGFMSAKKCALFQEYAGYSHTVAILLSNELNKLLACCSRIIIVEGKQFRRLILPCRS